MIKAIVKPLLQERNIYITFGLFNYHSSYVMKTQANRKKSGINSDNN